MKTWIFKGLAYMATAGAAATTVLLTVSSVGLKKSKSDSFPTLSGLIQDRPEVVESLLEPQEAPKPPVQPPPPPPGGPAQQAPDTDDGTKGDQKNPANGQQTPDPAAAQQPSGPSLPGGAVGGVPGGVGGGITCDDDVSEALDKIKQSLSTLPDIFANMDQQAKGIVGCVDNLKAKLLTGLSQPQTTLPTGPSTGVSD